MSRGRSDRRDLQIQAICQFVSRLAIAPENQHAAVLVSQLRKGAGKPTMSALRESGAIEESADVVLLLWWPHKDNDVADADKVVIQIGKNRVTGKLGTGVSKIKVGTQRFEEALPTLQAKEFWEDPFGQKKETPGEQGHDDP